MNIETIKSLKERAKEMLNGNYERKIDAEEIYTIICEWEQEKEKNEIMEKEFNRLEDLEDETEMLKILLKDAKEKYKDLSKCYDLLKLHYENELEDYIHKDKIREFIKNETFEGTYNFDTISAKRLKELLGENDKKQL